jgi:hypothetical protein
VKVISTAQKVGISKKEEETRRHLLELVQKILCKTMKIGYTIIKLEIV